MTPEPTYTQEEFDAKTHEADKAYEAGYQEGYDKGYEEARGRYEEK